MSALESTLPRGDSACGEASGPQDAFTRLIAQIHRDYVPFHVQWELTHVCNLACVMCYNVPQPQPELSTAECFAILEQLAAAGTLRLTFTGGEILTRRDFFAVATRARELGFALDLKTNGTLLTPALADQVAALDPVRVDISLLGASEETFDTVAGSRRSFTRVMRGIHLLLERGVRLRLNSLLLDLNLAEQREMAALVRSLGVEGEQSFKISPADDGGEPAAQHQLSLAEMVQVLETDGSPYHPQPPTPESRTCKVGLASCLISPYGVVYPCIEMRIPAGDLRHQQFAEIWANSPLFQQLRVRHTFANLPECQRCPINSYCEGRCSGLAWKEHGDLWGGHSLACQHAQARYAQVHPGADIPETPLQARLRTTEATPPASGQILWLSSL